MQLPAVIRARSERQAMDWSLVLASQGIETAIQRDPEEGAWGLLVNPPDYPRAVQAIRQFHVENRPGRWRQELPWAGLLFDFRSLAWFLLLVVIFACDHRSGGALRRAGLMNAQAFFNGEWWRVFTGTTLHGDLPHLAANIVTGVLFLGLAMGSYGSGLALFASVFGGVAGYLAGSLIYGVSYSAVGASGMVMGALGLLTADAVGLFQSSGTPRTIVIRAAAGGTLLLVLLGFSPDARTDVLAHVTGFIAGALIGTGLNMIPPARRNDPVLNRLAEALTALLFVVSWWAALR